MPATAIHITDTIRTAMVTARASALASIAHVQRMRGVHTTHEGITIGVAAITAAPVIGVAIGIGAGQEIAAGVSNVAAAGIGTVRTDGTWIRISSPTRPKIHGWSRGAFAGWCVNAFGRRPQDHSEQVGLT